LPPVFVVFFFAADFFVFFFAAIVFPPRNSPFGVVRLARSDKLGGG
jgi:hypothetical protein